MRLATLTHAHQFIHGSTYEQLRVLPLLLIPRCPLESPELTETHFIANSLYYLQSTMNYFNGPSTTIALLPK
jgi:hypothetical protein